MDIPKPPAVWPPAPTMLPPEMPKPTGPKVWLTEFAIRSITVYVPVLVVRLIIEPRSAMVWQLNLFLAAVIVSLTALSMWIKTRRQQMRARRNKKQL